MKYRLITTNEELADICHQIEGASWIALDTEFVRTKTYFPQLGLIQLYVREHDVMLVDPLNITEWAPFIAILNSPEMMKVFHACNEDLEVFQHEFGVIPAPIFDTQIAAAFTSDQSSAGFATLVSEYLDVTLDKTETRTNWLARPLTENQCHYAAADVFYLLPLAEKLYDNVVNMQREHLVLQECEMMREKRSRFVDPQLAYLSITHAWQLDQKALAYLQRLAAWRLTYAMEKNISLNFVLHEKLLWSIASHQPMSLSHLNELGLKQVEVRLFGQIILEMMKAPVSPESYPEKIIRVIELPQYRAHFKKIKAYTEHLATTLQLSPTLIASTRQINQYILWHHHITTTTPDLMSGWRVHYFEKELVKIMGKSLPQT